jgi:hypothetical protein
MGTSFLSLGGNGAADVWAVGDVLTHWDGNQWSVPADAGIPLRAVWSRSPQEAYAVGDQGVIVQWDGKSWTRMSSGTTEILRDVWGVETTGSAGASGTAGVKVYAVGDHGTILSLASGAGWMPMVSGTAASIGHVRASSDGNVFATDGGLLHLRDGAWERISGAADELWVTPTSVYVGGPQAADGSNSISRLDLVGVNCRSPERNCNDGWDNDCDGFADGADKDCGGQVVEQCANRVDDDGDGLVDCDDPDCAVTCSRR